jgi:5-formyltetrahydrofolate cyclo-ligase
VDNSNPVLEEKRALRTRMKAWRASLSAAEQVSAGQGLAAHGLEFLQIATPSKTSVSAFAPMADELRVWPLLRRLASDGFRLCLPVMQGKGRPLVFRAWTQGDAMDSGVWGIAEPKADKPVVEPDVLLMPLLAFDSQGWRLGYGGGFYDRTLHRLRGMKRVVTVGLAFDAQEVDAVPRLDYDERLDWVLTPSGPRKMPGSG